MTNFHQLLLTHGLVRAREMVSDKADRQRLEIAAAMLEAEEQAMAICHGGFALTGLPHKQIVEPVWRRENAKITMLVESGRDRSGDLIGIPYGSKARMILIYLQTKAVQTQSPEVELGRSMRAWMAAMGMEVTGGATYKVVAEQARRISACRLTFFTDVNDGAIRTNGSFVEREFSLAGTMTDQPTLWQECVRLDRAFFQSLIDHPVPVSETALRQIGNKSMAIDMYIWLAFRLHCLNKPTPVSWAALFQQFGSGFALPKHFKPAGLESLKTALAAYPDARVDIEDTGVVLHPSRPPIAKAQHRLGTI